MAKKSVDKRVFAVVSLISCEEVQQLHKRELEMLAAFGASERELQVKEVLQRDFIKREFDHYEELDATGKNRWERLMNAAIRAGWMSERDREWGPELDDE